MNSKQFEIYINKIRPMIEAIIRKPISKYNHDYTVFGDNNLRTIKINSIAHESRAKSMREGEIAQVLIGNFPGWKDLKIGDNSGCDCIKTDNSVIIEIKNKYNTMNSSSRYAVLYKLAKYKQLNPNTKCILGIVNAKKRPVKKIHYPIDNIEVIELHGDYFLDYVFTFNGHNYKKYILDFVKDIYKNEIPRNETIIK